MKFCMTKRQRRDFVVRCIEDMLFALFLIVCIWLICTVAGGALRVLGVG